MKGLKTTGNQAAETALWQARANALLGVFVAAAAIVNREAILTTRRGNVIVGRADYDRLTEAVFGISKDREK